MEENFYKKNSSEDDISTSDATLLDDNNTKEITIKNDEIIQEDNFTKNKNIIKIQEKSDLSNKGAESGFIGHIERLSPIFKDVSAEHLNNPNTKNSSDFIYSNTLLLMIIAIISFIHSYNSSKNNDLYKFRNKWIIFMLFLISCFAAITNFSVQIGNGYSYRVSIYINQFIMFLFGLLLIYNILRENKVND